MLAQPQAGMMCLFPCCKCTSPPPHAPAHHISHKAGPLNSHRNWYALEWYRYMGEVGGGSVAPAGAFLP